MKNFTLFCAICITIISLSCSSDDDAVTQDPIIGKWTLSQRFQNGVETQLTECFKTNEVIFVADGTLKSTFHRIATNNSCEFSHEASGTWENLGNNKYTMIEGDDKPYVCEINEAGTVFSIEDNFEFQGEEILLKDVLTKN